MFAAGIRKLTKTARKLPTVSPVTLVICKEYKLSTTYFLNRFLLIHINQWQMRNIFKRYFVIYHIQQLFNIISSSFGKVLLFF